MAPWSCWKWKTCAHGGHLECNSVDWWCTFQDWRKLSAKFGSQEEAEELGPHGPPPPLIPRTSLTLFVVICYFVGFVSFVFTILDKLHFQSKVGLSQINIKAPIRSKLKLRAFFIKWGSRTKFLFVGQQEIVNYLDFPTKVSRNCHKNLVLKIIWQD